MKIADLYALLERLLANAEEQKRYRDAAELKEALRLFPRQTGPSDIRIDNQEFYGRGLGRLLAEEGLLKEDGNG